MPSAHVMLSLATNPGGDGLLSSSGITDGAGVAHFPGLAINRGGYGYTFAATSGSVSSSGSSLVNVAGFSETGSISAAFSLATATKLTDGKVLFAGGITLGGAPQYSTATAQLYDPVTGAFTATGGPMSDRRYLHTATLLADGRVLIAGGSGCPGGATPCVDLATAEIYDPTSKTFSPTGSMSTARSQHTATLLPNGKVLIAGGSIAVGTTHTTLATAESFDPQTGSFTPTGPMNTPREDYTATLLPDGKVLIAAGVCASATPTVWPNTAEIYDPGTGGFTLLTATLTYEREGHTATLLPNGNVLLAGGYNGGTVYVDVAEIYDPVSQTFARAAGGLGMRQPRAWHTGTLLSDGTVLLAGGSPFPSMPFTDAAEIYDQAADTFTTTGKLVVPHTDHPASLLDNGLVLVAGGWSRSVRAVRRLIPKGIASLEFYVQPAGGSAGAPIAPAVQVRARDANGVQVVGAPVFLTLVNAGGATLSGNLATTDAAGIATFNALQVSSAGAGYQLRAWTPRDDVNGVLSSPFTISLRPPPLAVQTSAVRPFFWPVLR